MLRNGCGGGCEMVVLVVVRSCCEMVVVVVVRWLCWGL
jgi:hypothetical protein